MESKGRVAPSVAPTTATLVAPKIAPLVAPIAPVEERARKMKWSGMLAGPLLGKTPTEMSAMSKAKMRRGVSPNVQGAVPEEGMGKRVGDRLGEQERGKGGEAGVKSMEAQQTPQGPRSWPLGRPLPRKKTKEEPEAREDPSKRAQKGSKEMELMGAYPPEKKGKTSEKLEKEEARLKEAGGGKKNTGENMTN